MTTIIFETHSTSIDNEAGVSSGHYDVELSELGKKQAKELGDRYKNDHFETVFCSDLKRSYHTAEIAFAGRDMKIIKDKRLREIDYGEMTRRKAKETKPLRGEHVSKPWPGGQSFEETTELVKNILKEILNKYNGEQVLIIGHLATRCALEYFVNKVPLKQTLAVPWKWQPGWRYELKNSDLT